MIRLSFITTKILTQHSMEMSFLDSSLRTVSNLRLASFVKLEDEEVVPIRDILDIHKTREEEQPKDAWCHSNFLVTYKQNCISHINVDSFEAVGDILMYKQGDNTSYLGGVKVAASEIITLSSTN